MAWVIRIRECRLVDVLIAGGARKGAEGRFPGVTRTRRVCMLVPSGSIQRIVGDRHSDLPVHRGAGPCGTLARSAPSESLMAWSVTNLIEPLAAYYATYEPPLRFGAKSTPRGRRVV